MRRSVRVVGKLFLVKISFFAFVVAKGFVDTAHGMKAGGARVACAFAQASQLNVVRLVHLPSSGVFGELRICIK